MSASARTLTPVPAPEATRCGVVAHRGASGEFPEQTLVAYEQAISQGAEALEVDIRLTADGVLVCHHDPTTDRTSDRRLWVHASTVEQLSGLDYGSWHPVHRRHEPLMPLRRLLVFAEAYPQLKIFIETKHPVPSGGRVEHALAEELREGINTPAGRVFAWTLKLVAARRALPHLHARVESRALPSPDPRVLLLRRDHPLGVMLGVYNFSAESLPFPASLLRDTLGGGAVDHLSGERFTFGRPTVRLDPYRALWLTSPEEGQEG